MHYLLKPSEAAPLSPLTIARVVEEADVPPVVVYVATGNGPAAGRPLPAHRDVDKISFTGSTATDQSIHRCLGRERQTGFSRNRRDIADRVR